MSRQLKRDFYELVTHAGIVEDAKDPLKNGRLKVRVLVFDGLEKTVKDLRWNKVSEGFAGFGYGDFWRPKVGDLVWVDCDTGDPDQRIVKGSWYQLKEDKTPNVPVGFRIIEPFEEDSTEPTEVLPDAVDPKNEDAYSDPSGEPHHYIKKTPNGHIFAINEKNETEDRTGKSEEQLYFRTKKGHTICLSDTDDKEFVYIRDSHGNYIYFDTDKDDLFIKVLNNFKIDVGNDLNLVVGNDVNTKVGNDNKNEIINDVKTTIGNNWTVKVTNLINFLSATLSISNNVTSAIVDSWTWVGSTHTRSGQTNDSGPNAHG